MSEKRKEIPKSAKMWFATDQGMEPIRGYQTYEIISTPTKGVNIVNFYGTDKVILTTQGEQVFTEFTPENIINQGPIYDPKTFLTEKWETTNFPEPEYDRTQHQAATRDMIEKLGIKSVILPGASGKKVFHQTRIVEICLDPDGTSTTLTWLNAHKTPRTTNSDTIQAIALTSSESQTN